MPLWDGGSVWRCVWRLMNLLLEYGAEVAVLVVVDGGDVEHDDHLDQHPRHRGLKQVEGRPDVLDVLVWRAALLHITGSVGTWYARNDMQEIQLWERDTREMAHRRYSSINVLRNKCHTGLRIEQHQKWCIERTASSTWYTTNDMQDGHPDQRDTQETCVAYPLLAIATDVVSADQERRQLPVLPEVNAFLDVILLQLLDEVLSVCRHVPGSRQTTSVATRGTDRCRQSPPGGHKGVVSHRQGETGVVSRRQGDRQVSSVTARGTERCRQSPPGGQKGVVSHHQGDRHAMDRHAISSPHPLDSPHRGQVWYLIGTNTCTVWRKEEFNECTTNTEWKYYTAINKTISDTHLHTWIPHMILLLTIIIDTFS